MTAPPLVTQHHLEELVRRLLVLEKRVGRVEVREATQQIPSTYVPTYGGATAAGITTYTTQVGSYLVMGWLTLVWGQVVWTAASGTGNAQISLPSIPSVISTLGNVRSQAVTFAAGAPEVLTSGGFLQLRSPATNAATTPVAVEAAGDLIFAIAYM